MLSPPFRLSLPIPSSENDLNLGNYFPHGLSWNKFLLKQNKNGAIVLQFNSANHLSPFSSSSSFFFFFNPFRSPPLRLPGLPFPLVAKQQGKQFFFVFCQHVPEARKRRRPQWKLCSGCQWAWPTTDGTLFTIVAPPNGWLRDKG